MSELTQVQIKNFVPLHVHTEYSLLDGAARISRGKSSPLLEACKKKGMPACAITDHGNMMGVFTFFKKAKEMGIKPIIGCEFYVSNDMHKQTPEKYHLVLLAKTTQGYRNIVKMDSLAYTEGFYYKPRIDIELLKKYSEGVVCLSACLGGKVASCMVNGEYEQAKEHALLLKSIFDEGDFYIEIQDHGIADQKRINPLLIKLAAEIGVKTVATNDTHYIEKSDAEMHDVLLCIQTGKTLDSTSRMKFEGEEFYLKDYDEMMDVFSWCPEAVTNTMEVMEKCNIEIDRQDLMPPYKPEDGSQPAEFLRKIAYKGLQARYGEITQAIRERAEYELDIIIRTGFAEYYLIVWDFIRFAQSKGIPVGAGRGSGVGSLIAYAIHITNVDPLKYNLLFERFLNPERVSAPDFDIDFCMDRRGEVIDYVIEKYGSEKVCQILALGTMKAKGAIKDVARVYAVPLDIVNKTTKPIPNTPGVTLEKVLGRHKDADMSLRNAEVIEIYENNPDMHRVIDMALQIEGMPRNCSKHAAGVVICKEVISDFVPLQKNGNDITTQFQKDEVEELGMLKMDFLGLTTLTDLSKARQYVYDNCEIDIDFEKLGYEDPEVYKLIGSGDTAAVFQLESGGMKDFMKKLQPECMEDIIAGISLYRPGPIDSIPGFVEAKHNPQKIKYDHPLLEPILKMTYGFLVYQEQVMQVVQSLAGYTLGRADILRRAMGKKKIDVMKAEKQVFINGCAAKETQYYNDGSVKSKATPAVDGAIKRGVSKEIASKIFDDMESFAKYAFNKSHAAAYAVLAYETAFYKKYYPVELFAAVINDRITKADEIAKYLLYIKDMGKEILPPDINKSDVIFRATKEGAIRFGLNGIKNVGEAAMQLLVDERKANGEYKSINDMLERLPAGTINKKLFESLIKAGALDLFGHTRASLMAHYESLIAKSNYEKKMQATGQMSLFGLMEDINVVDEIEHVQEFKKSQLLSLEKEVLNIYMSGHPLDEYKEILSQMPFNLLLIKDLLSSNDSDEEEEIEEQSQLLELANEYNNKQVTIGGMLTNFRKKTTKSGKLMGYGVLEDMYGAIDVLFFPNTLDKYKDKLQDDSIVKISGRLNTLGDRGVNLSATTVTLWENDNNLSAVKQEQVKQEEQEQSQKLYVKINDRKQLGDLSELVDFHPGRTPIFVQFDQKLFEFPKKVRCGNKFIIQLEALVGQNNVKLVNFEKK